MKLNLDAFKNKLHFPVLIREVLSYCNLSSLSQNNICVDATFGFGGYSEALLKYSMSNVIALDRDASTIKYAKRLYEIYGERFQWHHAKFSNVKELLHGLGINKVDAIVADLGLSTMQIHQDQRGFSFQKDEPLSMSMGLNNIDASEFINTASAKLIADVLYHYGEEYQSRRIAQAIVKYRNKNKIYSTLDLANIIHDALKRKHDYSAHKKRDSATKSFQAIRIYINDELNELQLLLDNSLKLLTSQGRLLVVSFHSLEDRIVKQFMRNNSLVRTKISKFTFYKQTKDIIYNMDMLDVLTKYPITPTEEEVKLNRASKSAKLRVAQKR